MRKTIWLVLVAALVVGLVAAVAAGCGNETTTTTTAGGTDTTAGGTATTAGPTTTAAGTETTVAAGEPVMGGIVKTGTVSHPSRFGFPAKVFGPDQFFEGLFLEMMFNPTDRSRCVHPPARRELGADARQVGLHLPPPQRCEVPRWDRFQRCSGQVLLGSQPGSRR